MVQNSVFPALIHEALKQAKFPSNPASLYDPIRYILSLSGKRIRPMLVLMGADLFGFKEFDKVMPASLAIEYFHNFSLIHDDIMDKAPLRRGQGTVHQVWNDNVAILSGDALLVKAYEELAKCPVYAIPALLNTFNQVAIEVCEGQQVDMDFESRHDVVQDAYVDMIRQKTSVLLGGALKMGAIIAGANDTDTQRIYDFGVNLGIAFQLQDDILDVYGDPESFGKQVGGDILADKKTILYILLHQQMQQQDLLTYQELISNVNISDEAKVSAVKALYQQYNVKAAADELKSRFTQLAFDDLLKIDVKENNKADLIHLAKSLMERSR